MERKLKIIHELVDLDLSQRELARRAQINETILSRLLRGRYVPTSDEKLRIANALGKPVSDLFS